MGAEMMDCKKCLEQKAVNMFYKNRTRSRGRDDYCISCRQSYMHRWLEAEKVKEIKINMEIKNRARDVMLRAVKKRRAA